MFPLLLSLLCIIFQLFEEIPLSLLSLQHFGFSFLPLFFNPSQTIFFQLNLSQKSGRLCCLLILQFAVHFFSQLVLHCDQRLLCFFLPSVLHSSPFFFLLQMLLTQSFCFSLMFQSRCLYFFCSPLLLLPPQSVVLSSLFFSLSVFLHPSLLFFFPLSFLFLSSLSPIGFISSELFFPSLQFLLPSLFFILLSFFPQSIFDSVLFFSNSCLFSSLLLPLGIILFPLLFPSSFNFFASHLFVFLSLQLFLSPKSFFFLSSLVSACFLLPELLLFSALFFLPQSFLFLSVLFSSLVFLLSSLLFLIPCSFFLFSLFLLPSLFIFSSLQLHVFPPLLFFFPSSFLFFSFFFSLLFFLPEFRFSPPGLFF
ncbi:hypothetical protein BLNAU_23426 [Blattamonas nauphoetae]|uniref:Uncharacterized protein n=1 Tax=Blattamonas nauphoetae TaxID=2049346 RepID=A0ABQ9WQA4_9EUKA|nr:hypothetical protein BLNAU_23426 [Blattamonas nauphoetae]